MRISVIIPTYNRESTIERSIRSVLNQTYAVDEIIVIDDCGTDNTKTVIEKIGNEKIKYIKLSENGGPANARNIGVDMASGDWIAFHDSDDEWNLDKIEKQVAYINNNPECRFIYCSYECDWNKTIVPLNFGLSHYEGEMLDVLLIRNTIGAPTILMEKQLFQKVGGFETSLKSLEDWEFALKIAKEEYIGFINEPLIRVYRVDESVSFNSIEYLNSKCYIIGKYKSELLKYNLFNNAVITLMSEANQMGIEEQIERLLTLYISM